MDTKGAGPTVGILTDDAALTQPCEDENSCEEFEDFPARKRSKPLSRGGPEWQAFPTGTGASLNSRVRGLTTRLEGPPPTINSSMEIQRLILSAQQALASLSATINSPTFTAIIESLEAQSKLPVSLPSQPTLAPDLSLSVPRPSHRPSPPLTNIPTNRMPRQLP